MKREKKRAPLNILTVWCTAVHDKTLPFRTVRGTAVTERQAVKTQEIKNIMANFKNILAASALIGSGFLFAGCDKDGAETETPAADAAPAAEEAPAEEAAAEEAPAEEAAAEEAPAAEAEEAAAEEAPAAEEAAAE